MGIEKISITLDDSPTSENSTSFEAEIAEAQKDLFSGDGIEELGEEEDSGSNPLPDISQISHLFEKGGVGLSSSEWVQVYYSLEKLCKDVNPASCRFFGKILGLQKNYYVAEIQYRDEEEYEEEEEENPLPKSQWKPEKKVPKEVPGQAGA